MDTILQIVVIVILTFLEGVFVAAEIALVTVRRTRIDQLVEEGNRSAKRVKRLVAQPGRFLAVTPDRADLPRLPGLRLRRGQPDHQPREPVRGLGHLDPCLSPRAALALIIVTLILSLFTIVFGELVPKSLALAHDGALRTPPERLHRDPAARPRPARPRPHGDHHERVAACSGRATRRSDVMSDRGAHDPGRARRRAGHPRGRGGADDPARSSSSATSASTRSWSRASRW